MKFIRNALRKWLGIDDHADAIRAFNPMLKSIGGLEEKSSYLQAKSDYLEDKINVNETLSGDNFLRNERTLKILSNRIKALEPKTKKKAAK